MKTQPQKAGAHEPKDKLPLLREAMELTKQMAVEVGEWTGAYSRSGYILRRPTA